MCNNKDVIRNHTKEKKDMYFAVENNKEGKEVITTIENLGIKVEVREYSSIIFVNTDNNLRGYISKDTFTGVCYLSFRNIIGSDEYVSIDLDKFETIYNI